MSRIALLFLLLLSTALVACGSDDADTVAGADAAEVAIPVGAPIADSTDAVIVTSNFGTDTLTLQQFGQQYFGFVQQVSRQDPTLQADTLRLREIRRQIAQAFVLQHVIEGLAEQEPPTAEDTVEVNNRIQAFRAQVGEEQFQQQLDQQGIVLDTLRHLGLLQARAERVQRAIADAVGQPSAEDVETFRREQAEEVRANQIAFFLYPNYTPAQRDSVERLAEAVLDSIQAGASFTELADRYSADPSAPRGGDTDYFNRSAGLPSAFTEAAFALADSGDVTTDLVRTPVGLHIIELTDRRMGVPMDTTRARGLVRAERQEDELRRVLIERFREAGGEARINETLLEIDLNDTYELG
jgi:peptidyl-prolyl cis-trans isomerase C